MRRSSDLERIVDDLNRIELLDDAMVQVLRTKTPAERIAMGLDCNHTARLRIEGHLRSEHPDWSDSQIAAEIAGRMSLGF